MLRRALLRIRVSWRPADLAWALLPTLFLLAACTSANPAGDQPAEEPLPPSFEPIVFPHSGAAPGQGTGARVMEDRPVSDADAGWAEKLQLAKGYAAGGFDGEALDVIRRSLACNPPDPWAQRLKDLRSSLRVRRIETELLRVDARGARDYVPFQTGVDWQIRLRNVADHRIVIPPAGAVVGASPSVASVTMLRRDLDIYAAELRRTWNQTVPLQRGEAGRIVIPRGGQHVLTVRVPPQDAGRALSGLRILELSGTLRVVVVDGAGESHGVTLPIRAGRVVVVPRGFEPLARNPVASMRTAVDATAPTHLLVAAEFVARDQQEAAAVQLARALEVGEPALRTASLGALGLIRERAIGRPLAPLAAPLVEALTRTPSRFDGLAEGLTRLSGRSLPSDPRLWVDWLRRVRARGTLVQAPENPESGVFPGA